MSFDVYVSLPEMLRREKEQKKIQRMNAIMSKDVLTDDDYIELHRLNLETQDKPTYKSDIKDNSKWLRSLVVKMRIIRYGVVAFGLIVISMLLFGCESQNNGISNPNTSTRCEGFVVSGTDVYRCYSPAFPPQTRCSQHR